MIKGFNKFINITFRHYYTIRTDSLFSLKSALFHQIHIPKTYFINFSFTETITVVLKHNAYIPLVET